MRPSRPWPSAARTQGPSKLAEVRRYRGCPSERQATHFFPLLLKVAVTEIALLSVTVQVPVLLHPPPSQPLNCAPCPGTAVRVMTAPFAYLAGQIEPQLIPPGLLLTVPGPFVRTVRV